MDWIIQYSAKAMDAFKFRFLSVTHYHWAGFLIKSTFILQNDTKRTVIFSQLRPSLLLNLSIKCLKTMQDLTYKFIINTVKTLDQDSLQITLHTVSAES